MTKNAMGYPLPSGDAYTDDLACIMLMYPNKPEYRQALMSAYFYFGNWLAWERDPQKKGADAALAWKEAIEATLECIEMNACETIIELLTDIRANTGVYCCDVVDISDGDQYTDEVEDGVGDVPQNIIDAGYADDAADWDGFYDYKCMISHLMVENLKGSTGMILARLDTAEAALVTVAAVAAIALAIATAGGAILVYGVALSAAGVAGLYAAMTLLGALGLTDLLEGLDEHEDALACAIYEADGSANALIALKAEIDNLFNVAEAAFLKNLNLGPQLKALYAGRYDQQDIAEIMANEGYDVLDYVCDCETPDPLESGANLELVRIQEVNYHTDNDPIWTVHAIDEEYGNGVEFDVTHNHASGHYFYIDLTLKPSQYHTDPDASFRGLTYLLVSTATGTEYSIDAVGVDMIQIADDAGFGRRTSWFGLHSEPYAGFKEDCEAILENNYYQYSGTDGLDQLPDQLRTISLRFVVPGVQRCFLRVHTMYLAINYTP
ncbi:MAG: hypothetical protein KAS19_09105 [Anaerolineales bacterium]|nr:hypothetical protein [Anaerolineales bacterium]